VPPTARTGKLTVTTPGGTSPLSATSFLVRPTITEPFVPTHGFAGTILNLAGNTFIGTSAVKVGGVLASFTVSSNTLLKVTIPSAGLSGAIAVTNAGGTTTTAATFTVDPKISSFSPSSAAVGTTITLNGTGFGASGATRVVQVNGTSAASVTWISSKKLTFLIPAGATAGRITLQVDGGAIATSSSNLTVS
jgi:hypothetical protein